MTAVADAAWAAYGAGLCVVPPRPDGSKAPVGNWKQYQTSRPDLAQMQRWYDLTSRAGLGLVTGAISGNLEPIDIDEVEMWPLFQQRMTDAGLAPLLDRIVQGYSERSPNGFHLVYRCDTIAGNTVLAQRPKRPEEMRDANDKVKTLIETRGEGGYIIVAPSNGTTHPSGAAYEMLSGSFATIATISADERTMLWAVAQSLDLMPAPDLPTEPAHRPPVASSGRPGDDFNNTARWSEVLEPHGWVQLATHGTTGLWRRPGKDIGLSATTNHLGYGRLYVFSTSSEIPAARWWDKFQTYAMLDHHGDFTAAATELSRKGYGQQSKTAGVQDARLTQRQEPEPGREPDTEPLPEPEDKYSDAFIDWSTFWDEETAADEWLAEPLIPAKRQTVIYSPAKVGKSLLLLDICARLASGNRVLDQAKGPPQHILYIDLEMTRDDVRDRLREMGYGPEFNPAFSKFFHYAVLPALPPLDTYEGGQALLGLCRRHSPTLVVIDTTSRVLQGGENDADTMRAFYMNTGILIKASGIALVRLDHAGKDLDRGQRGTSAKNDDVDLVWQLTELDGGGIRLRATHRRQSWVPTLVDLARLEEPILRHERMAETTWPDGTEALARTMHDLDISPGASTRDVQTILQAAGFGARRAKVVIAIRYRKTYLMDVGNHTGTALLQMAGTDALTDAGTTTILDTEPVREPREPQEMANWEPASVPLGTEPLPRPGNSCPICQAPLEPGFVCHPACVPEYEQRKREGAP